MRLRRAPSQLASPPRQLNAPPKTADELYRSPGWHAFIGSIKATRGAWCEDCGSGHRVAGDHETEIKDGGAPFDPANIRLRCQACHNRVTAARRRSRIAG
jgi:DNA-directed RNA polymerase subunit RPC12/RpoP